MQQTAIEEAETTMKDYQSLSVWEKAHRLTLSVYKATTGFPREELYGVTSQLRRSCSSIPTNIAEGCGRNGDAEFARYLDIAMGSSSEMKYLIHLSYDLGYLKKVEYDAIFKDLTEIRQMLTALIRKIRTVRC